MNRNRTTVRRRAGRATALCVALAFVAAACGSDDGGPRQMIRLIRLRHPVTRLPRRPTSATTDSSALKGSVFYLMPNATTPRYVNSDAPAIEAALAEFAPEHDSRLPERRG